MMAPLSEDAPPAEAPASPASISYTSSPKSYGSPPKAGKKNNNLGLSELSKQLRILQNQNKVQQIEIDRLERQLKLLADLQNISVGDLRNALMQACKAEAHGELQRTVATLRAQLQAATLANQKGENVKEVSASNDTANLQLRLGELEEVEETQKAEIKKLYTNLSIEKERSTRLEAKCQQQQSEIEHWKAKAEREQVDVDDFLKELKAYRSKLSLMEATVQRQQVELDEWAALGRKLKNQENGAKPKSTVDESRFRQLQKQLAQERKHFKALEAELRKVKADNSSLNEKLEQANIRDEDNKREAQVEIQVSREKAEVMKEQLKTATEKNELRNDQFNARFEMQGERIQDLAQQLSSLYVAFELLKNDRSAEDATRDALRANLATADAKVAQQVEQMQNKDQVRATIRPPSSPVVNTNHNSVALAVVQQSPRQSPGRPPVLPQSPPAKMPPRSPPQSDTHVVLSGSLLLRTSGMVKQWKQKRVTLSQSQDRYQFVVHADEFSKQKSFSAQVGVSRVEPFSGRQFAFNIYADPRTIKSPVVSAAALDQEQFTNWMSALMYAMNTKSPRRQSRSDQVASPSPTPTPTRQNVRSAQIAPLSPGEQEDRDFALALQLSHE